MKKIVVSLVMVIILMFNIVSVGAVSVNEYPESRHNYSSNFYGHWTYSYGEDVDYLFVTFSEDTYFGQGGEEYYDEENWEYNCDYLTISSHSDYYYEIFFADDLAGKTILIPGNGFSISLVTDDKDNFYGFRIVDISTQGSFDEYVRVTYKIDEDTEAKSCVKLDENNALPISSDLKHCIVNDKSIIGWKDGDGHEYIYKNKSAAEFDDDYYRYSYRYGVDCTNVFEVKPGDEITLTPVYTSLSITPDETFSFHNSRYAFKNGYKMTDAHAKRLRECYFASTWYNQFGTIGLPLSFMLPDIYQKMPWGGSCCGFPIATLMQHYGMIDLCTEQNVSKVSDIQPTEQVTSALNFYNAVTPAAVVCANKAPEPGTDEYKAQIKALFETVSSGKPAICFIDCGFLDISYKNVFNVILGVLSKSIKYLKNSFLDTHCILLTGAYIDGDGNPVFIGYDENYASYCYGEPQIYKVTGDYEDLVEFDSEDSLGSIAWLSDISCLESFKADEKINPSAWYSYYRANRAAL